MTSNPRHSLPPRLRAHQPTRFATAQESSARVHRPEAVSFGLGSVLAILSTAGAPQAALDEENEMVSPRSMAAEPTDKAADAGRKSTAETARTVRPMSHEPSRANGKPTGMPKTASESTQTSVSTADPGFSSGV